MAVTYTFTGVGTRYHAHEMAKRLTETLKHSYCVVARPIQPIRWQVYSREYVDGLLAEGNLQPEDVEATYEPALSAQRIVDQTMEAMLTDEPA